MVPIPLTGRCRSSATCMYASSKGYTWRKAAGSFHMCTVAPLSITTDTVLANRAHAMGDRWAIAASAEPNKSGSKLESELDGDNGGESSAGKETRFVTEATEGGVGCSIDGRETRLAAGVDGAAVPGLDGWRRAREA